jgi:thymidylate kinase
MITVALIGPDGAGKTTISERLVNELELPVKRIYMGVNLDSSTLLLPTTRLLARVMHAQKQRLEPEAAHHAEPRRRTGKLRRVGGSLRAGARLSVWLSEEWSRQLVAWYYARLRGHVVVFDRHFYADYYDTGGGTNDERERLSTRIHLYLLEHAYPKPDLVIYLDAPAEVLFERKPETPVDWLRQRREDYLTLGERLPHFARVDATRPTDEVTRDVALLILSFREERGGTPRVDKRRQTS